MIAEILKVGRENYTTTLSLMARTGLNCSRDVRKEVARERINGAVILSNEKGYYLPATKEEVIQFIKTNDKKARSLEYALKSARSYLDYYTLRAEQMMIEEFDKIST